MFLTGAPRREKGKRDCSFLPSSILLQLLNLMSLWHPAVGKDIYEHKIRLLVLGILCTRLNVEGTGCRDTGHLQMTAAYYL